VGEKMISKKVVDYCKQQGWWYDDASLEYEQELKKLGVDLSTDFSQFYLHVEDGPTFISGGKEIFQICWFSKNTNFDLTLRRTHETLGIPQDYLPLDSFEGESGFFYNKITEEVFEISLGDSIIEFQQGRLKAQWPNFNEFLESFFELA
jgi:hypothetical protein